MGVGREGKLRGKGSNSIFYHPPLQGTGEILWKNESDEEQLKGGKNAVELWVWI